MEWTPQLGGTFWQASPSGQGGGRYWVREVLLGTDINGCPMQDSVTCYEVGFSPRRGGHERFEMHYRHPEDAMDAAEQDWALRQFGPAAEKNPTNATGVPLFQFSHRHKLSEGYPEDKQELVGLLQAPWVPLGDTLSAWMSWGWRLGEPHKDPSYLAQLRADEHYHLWHYAGYAARITGGPEFLGRFAGPAQANEAAKWDQKVRAGLGLFGPKKTRRNPIPGVERHYRNYLREGKLDWASNEVLVWRPRSPQAAHPAYSIESQTRGSHGPWRVLYSHTVACWHSGDKDELPGSPFRSLRDAILAAKKDWALAQFGPAQQSAPAKENPMRKPRKSRKNPGRSTYLRQRHPNLTAEDNPHTSEWLIVTPHSNMSKVRRVAKVLIDWGYATEVSIRRTMEGSKQALGVTLKNVPVIRVPIAPRKAGAAYAAGPPWRYAANIPTIESYLGQFGKVVGYATHARENPQKDKRMSALPRKYQGDDVYDPREEAVRAVARGTGGKWGVAVGTYLAQHSVGEVIQRSWERYQDPDAVLRKRQAYEVMLSEQRQSSPYRVTAEPTAAGLRYFVWPMRKGQRVPKAYTTMRAAERRLAETYYDDRPVAGLPRRAYTKAELSDWLPPESIFKGRSGHPTRAKITADRKATRTATTTTRCFPANSPELVRAYRRHDPDWCHDPELLRRYRAGKMPPKR